MPAIIPLLAQLMSYQKQRGLSDEQVAQSMGISPSTLKTIKDRWRNGSGAHILTIVAYAKCVGWPLVPTEDLNFVAPPAETARGETDRDLRIKEAARLHNAGLDVREISKVMQFEPPTIYTYLSEARAKSLLNQ